MSEKDMGKKIQISDQIGGFSIHFSNEFSQLQKDFEANISTDHALYVHDFDEAMKWTTLSFWNKSEYAEAQDRPYYVFQVKNLAKNFSFQVIIYIETNKVRFFKEAVILQWPLPIKALSDIQLTLLLNKLQTYLQKYANVMVLRIQPYLPGQNEIAYVRELLLKAGFLPAPPIGAHRTRLVDLRPSTENILKGFETRRRAQLFLTSDEAEILPIKSVRAIPHLQNALDHAFLRSVKKPYNYKFQPLLKVFHEHPKEISIYGFYFKDDLQTPRAFVTGIHHGNGAEYSIGGSLNDQRLRKFGFNNALLWKLMEEAKIQGCQWFDLGGITSGDSDDPTAGISRFKRKIPGVDITVGCEMQKVLRRPRYKLYNFLKTINNLVSAQ